MAQGAVPAGLPVRRAAAARQGSAAHGVSAAPSAVDIASRTVAGTTIQLCQRSGAYRRRLAGAGAGRAAGLPLQSALARELLSRARSVPEPDPAPGVYLSLIHI